jgi:hypothetical protein
MNTNSVTIGIGDVVTLSAITKPTNSTDTLKWSTSDKKIATVNKYGVVTALQEGSVTITVKTSSKKQAKCKIEVKNYLSEDEIVSLISADCLAEETIVDLIKKNSISEDKVKDLIKNNSISEAKVKALIQENTLSEEDIKKIVQENTSTTSEAGVDWEDGTNLVHYEKQILPLSENGITINSITIKKEHYDGEWKNRIQKYKYTIEIQGTIQEKKGYQEIDIQYLTPNDTSSETRYYTFKTTEENNIASTYLEDENGNFTLTVDQYNIFCDYESFFVFEMDNYNED